jgi:hypothetical protein
MFPRSRKKERMDAEAEEEMMASRLQLDLGEDIPLFEVLLPFDTTFRKRFFQSIR